MQTRFINSRTNLLALVALALLLMFVVRGAGEQIPFAQAGAAQNVSGFAWSSNIGYISFNSTDCDTNANGFVDTGACGGTDTPASLLTDYGVNIDFATGNFSGFAWSSSIGYINFNPDPDPTGNGCTSSPCGAHLDLVTNDVTGWARACSVLSAADCTGVAVKGGSVGGSVLGGWDGWIKLSDPSWTNPATYDYIDGVIDGTPIDVYDADGYHGIFFEPGVAPVTSKLKGFAWGGLILGWIDFALVDPPLPGGVIVGTPPPVGDPDISVTPLQLDFGDVEVTKSKILTFTITNTGDTGTLLSGTITVPPGEPFTLSSGNPFVTCTLPTSCTYDLIPDSGQGLLNVIFNPTVLLDGQTTQVTFDSTDASLADVVKTVLGNGAYLVSGPGLDFGNVRVTKTKDLVLTIINEGTVDYGLDTLSISNPVYSCVGACPVINLAPGVPNDVPIRFAPLLVQNYPATATLENHPSISYELIGAGVPTTFIIKDQ